MGIILMETMGDGQLQARKPYLEGRKEADMPGWMSPVAGAEQQLEFRVRCV